MDKEIPSIEKAAVLTFMGSGNAWLIKIYESGEMEFNKEVFPQNSPDDFATLFIKCVEKAFFMPEWKSVKDFPPPCDGSSFLGFDPTLKDVEIYVIQKDTDYPTEAIYRESAGERYYKWEPTHWTPLPPFPQDER